MSGASPDGDAGEPRSGDEVPVRAPSWEEHADWWQQEFTEGADAEYVEQIVPLALEHLAGCRRIVDIGTGEGQIARALAGAGGVEVVGADPTAAQVAEAARRGGGPLYVRAGCTALPFADAAFDGALVCLVFEHVDDLDTSLAEVARVLESGGRFVCMLNHPLIQTPESGMVVDHVLEPPETYWRVGPYLREAVTIDEVAKGVFVRFVHRPLSRYVNGLIGAGFDLEAMVEPSPPPGFLARAPEYEHELVATTPRLLLLRARRR